MPSAFTQPPAAYIVYSDYGFKRLFDVERHERRVVSLLNALLPPHRRVASVVPLKTDWPGEAATERLARLDLACEAPDGTRFDVEIQRLPQENFESRLVYYGARLISGRALRGAAWDYRSVPVVVIGLIDYTIVAGERVITYTLHDRILDRPMPGEPLLIELVQLREFTREPAGVANPLDEWVYLMNHPHDMTYEPKFLERDLVNDFFSDAEWGAMSYEERERYHNEWMAHNDRLNQIAYAKKQGIDQGIEMGRDQGIEIGRDQGIEIGSDASAKAYFSILRAKGMSNAQIADLLDIVTADVERLIGPDPN